MKKILLASTALVAFAASAAFAEGPTVTVGGKAKFEAGFTDQDDAYSIGNGNSRDAKFANDTRVNVKATGKADNGITYGAVIELQADISNSNDNSGTNADKTYLFIESGLGRVEMGGNYGPSKTLKVDASTFARASGGIDGDWYYFANTQLFSNAVLGANQNARGFIIAPDLPLDAGINAAGDTEDATKVTYYSPRFMGAQFGVSFIPDSGNRGTAAAFTSDSDASQYENAFDLGLNYTGQFNQFNVAGSVNGQLGEAERSNREDLRAYAVGASVTYSSFTLGGSYGNQGKSGLVKAGHRSSSDFWDIGGAYVQGPVGASISYLNSSYNKDKFSNISVGADYQLAPGLVPFAEVSFFELDPSGSVFPKNEGTVVLVGTQLNF